MAKKGILLVEEFGYKPEVLKNVGGQKNETKKNKDKKK